jgi:hypothetical protein
VGDPLLEALLVRLVIEGPVRPEVVALLAVGRLPEVRRLVVGRGLSVCCESKPVRARYRSSSPGTTAFAMRVATVVAPTQYSRRRGCSAAKTTARAATSGW